MPRRLAFIFAMLTASPASANQPAGTAPSDRPQISVEAAAERHFTTNALESDLQLADWYTLLRGTSSATIGTDGGTTTLRLEAETTRFDELSIEDDSAVSVALEAEQAVGESLALRGTVGWALKSEGDDFDIGGLVIGSRTVTSILSAGLAAGYDLGGGFGLRVEAGAARETPWPTSFEAGLIAPLLLTPPTNRFSGAAGMERRGETWLAGMSASGELVAAGTPGIAPYHYRLWRGATAVHGTWKAASGLTVSARAGAELLSVPDIGIRQLRPLASLEIDMPFDNGVELRLAASAAFDTKDGDDPVASRLERAEAELAVPLAERIRLAGGIFAERRSNLTLGYDERSEGAYGQIGYELRDRLGVVLRLDAERTRHLPGPFRFDTLDAYVGLTASM